MTNITTTHWIDGSSETNRVPAASELNLKRLAPGYYQTTDGQWTIHDLTDVNGSLIGWVVQSEWDRYDVIDPVETFGEAKISLAETLGSDTVISRTPARWVTKYDENHEAYQVAVPV